MITYNKLIEEINKNGLEKTAKKVNELYLGVFEPLDNCHLEFSLKNLEIKPFSAKVQNIPLAIIDHNKFILSSQSLTLDDSMNSHYPGEFSYGGAFLIEDLINNKAVDLRITGYANDVYKDLEAKKENYTQ